MANKNLHKAKKAKSDEFYTQLADIEKELWEYKDYFKDKVIYCNCDDPRVSNFVQYFTLNFKFFGLKKLISTCYKHKDIWDFGKEGKDDSAIALIYEGTKNENQIPDDEDFIIKPLKGDGDFRSLECIEFLKEADIVVTNPPFSLFREYVDQLMAYQKKFIILGNNNAITYKEIFRYIKEGQLWLGYNANKTIEFIVPDDYPIANPKTRKIIEGIHYQQVPAITWFTNLNHKKRNEDLILYKKYNEQDYPKYDNYDAIEVSKIKDIPEDYYEVMGVPITFLDKHNPEQFEIVGIDRYVIEENFGYVSRFFINGKEKYARILIKRKN